MSTPSPGEKAFAEKMRREFTANVSHEMKSPLQVISGYAELMANGLVPPEDVQRFGQLIYEESQAMRALIDDVLTLSRLDEMEVGEEAMTLVDVSEVAQQVKKRLESSAERAQVELELKVAPALIRGDAILVEQMIYNLISNGIRYNRPGGKVVTEVSTETPLVIIRVCDTGHGIPADKREKIFQRFYRLEKSRSKETGGTGLGLAIVKHAALYHGGSVLLESEEGKGSCFTIELPAAGI